MTPSRGFILTNSLFSFLSDLPIERKLIAFLFVCCVLLAIAIISWFSNLLVKKIVIRFLFDRFVAHHSFTWLRTLKQHKTVFRLSHLLPGLIVYSCAPLVILDHHDWTKQLAHVIDIFALIYILYAVVWFLLSLLNTVLSWYATLTLSNKHPIRGYVQVVKIFVFVLAAILTISIIIGKSPWLLLTGLGAVSAVLLLVFKDTIVGFAANIQISAYDMVRIGDWITIPSYGVDGDVLEISVNTVKVQNFDKTILTVPTNALIASGVQNWRGMSESGGRRIKRSIRIDIDSIKFCSVQLLEKLAQLRLLTEHIERKEEDIRQYHQQKHIDTEILGNGRQLTNIGLFRAYTEGYLREHPQVQQSMTFLIRQLEPTETGLPLQLYIFTNDTDWVRYEAIQADIFDHLLAVLPVFELHAYQTLSGVVPSS